MSRRLNGVHTAQSKSLKNSGAVVLEADRLRSERANAKVRANAHLKAISQNSTTRSRIQSRNRGNANLVFDRDASGCQHAGRTSESIRVTSPRGVCAFRGGSRNVLSVASAAEEMIALRPKLAGMSRMLPVLPVRRFSRSTRPTIGSTDYHRRPPRQRGRPCQQHRGPDKPASFERSVRSGTRREARRGYLVFAYEIKSLAEKTAKATARPVNKSARSRRRRRIRSPRFRQSAGP